jgi:diphosphomevalonate decarboxylase
MKATAIACGNQGLIKYWGNRDDVLRLPSNNSIGVCVSGLTSKTTVEFSSEYRRDACFLDGVQVIDDRVVAQLNVIRRLAEVDRHAKVVTENSFPARSGLGSSASGFAALTLAASLALDLRLDERALSRIARLASGSACRSVVGGFSEWIMGSSDKDSYARLLASAEGIDLRILVVIVDTSGKDVSNAEGMRITSRTSPFYASRLEQLPVKLRAMRQAIQHRDLLQICQLAESDTLNMHACMWTSDPPLIYWSSGTLNVIHKVREMRKDGIPAFFSIDAGANVFVNLPSRYEETAKAQLLGLDAVRSVMSCAPGGPAHVDEHHLF